MNRRNLLKTIGSGIAGVGVMPIACAQDNMKSNYSKLKGNISFSLILEDIRKFHLKT